MTIYMQITKFKRSGFRIAVRNIIIKILELEHLKNAKTCLDPSIGLSMHVYKVSIHLVTTTC
jgi:hypothetical protein